MKSPLFPLDGVGGSRSRLVPLLWRLSSAATLAGTLTATCPAQAQVQTQGYFFDWALRDAASAAQPRYTPIPLPGHDYSANHIYYKNLFASQIAAGKPTGFLLHESEAPVKSWPNLTASPTEDTVLGWAPACNFVFADFEHADNNLDNMTTMVNKVRASTNAQVNTAYVGNYASMPGASDLAMPYLWQTDQSVRANNYANSHVNVAMPNCYPYAYFLIHTTTVWPAGQRCPNQRAALSWAPLERFSLAKRNLPAGHMLIPFVMVYMPWDGYHSVIPPKEDHLALIKHYRLRGADGIYRQITTDKTGTFTDAGYSGEYFVPRDSWLYSYSELDHANDIVASWDELNDMFGTPVRTLLNLDTDKTTGVLWSGVRSANTVKILVSNLSGTGAKTVDLSSVQFNGVPATSPSVADGTHQMLTYTISNLVQNGSFDTDATGWYFTAATRSATGGTGDSGCLKLQNGQYAAVGMQPLRVEPNARISVSFNARGDSSPYLRLGFYTLNSSQQIISFFTPGDWTNLSATFAPYSGNFTVPNDPNIRYVKPILYNWNSPTDPTDVICLDDFTVKFTP